MSSIPPDPYRAPIGPIGPVVASTADPAVVALRRGHLQHERAVRTFGFVFYIAAAWFGVFVIASLPGSLARLAHLPSEPARKIGYVVGYVGSGLGVTGTAVALGSGLRRLSGRARWFVAIGIISAIGLFVAFLLNQPWGHMVPGAAAWVAGSGLLVAAILGYLLSLVVSKRAAVVFSDPYRAAVAATPELTSRASLIVRLSFGLMMALAGIALLTALGNLLFFD